jgi:hypothetical protein
MFFDIKKSIDFRYCFLKLCSFALILLSTRGLAAECSVLRLQTHRSLGATITHNTCPSATDLALESVIELQAGTRVWLESVEKYQQTKGYQIVCLNKSSAVQKLKIVSANSPWLASPSLPDCSSWLANRLACKQPHNQNEVLLCAISQKPSPVVMRAVQSKTSVTVRGFDDPLQVQSAQEQANWSRFVSPSIGLCRRLLNTNQTITLSWTIEVTGTVSHASIVETGIDRQFSACALEALEHIDFPDVIHETRLTVSF